MIAVVSSTVAPSALPTHDGLRTTLSPEKRLEQTKATVASLVAFGARRVLVADNSPGSWLAERPGQLGPAEVIHLRHPVFGNKGVGEQWLLLAVADLLPEDEPIIKISGRYLLNKSSELRIEGDDDIAGKIYPEGRTHTLSTRAYLLRNKAVALRFWGRALDEVYAQPARIMGARSLIRIVGNSLRPERDGYAYSDPSTLSLEHAAYRAIRNLGLKLRAVGTLGVEGNYGSFTNQAVSE